MNDQTPGLWQDDEFVIVLSRVTCTAWSVADEDDEWTTVPRSQADALRVWLHGDDEPIKLRPAEKGESFIRALNLHYETRKIR